MEPRSAGQGRAVVVVASPAGTRVRAALAAVLNQAVAWKRAGSLFCDFWSVAPLKKAEKVLD